eukprot:CAMPEP_0118648234 /NCGR_PEP_ID=MMETSP0785-20121206/9044_1 /TAXON_ID=91992 /ORGANISM="Bolidomonas pacifica, Strain CCMP 1866" /LENGTH=127 /DNA_ID=CAMNT_0006540407 /DNA_START=52 /DNA_END=431 /DNA_ORIENTATION=-
MSSPLVPRVSASVKQLSALFDRVRVLEAEKKEKLAKLAVQKVMGVGSDIKVASGEGKRKAVPIRAKLKSSLKAGDSPANKKQKGETGESQGGIRFDNSVVLDEDVAMSGGESPPFTVGGESPPFTVG